MSTAQRVLPKDAIVIPKAARRVFTGQIFDVYQWPQTMFDGSTETFEMLKRPDTVTMICVMDDKIVFITEKQPNRPEFTRIPGGRVDEGESWQTAVERECKEELGLRFKNWRLVGVRQPTTKIEWFVATYLATDCLSQEAPTVDVGEKISILTMSFDEAKRYVASTVDPLNAYTRELFEGLETLDDLLALPEYTGRSA